MAKKLITEFTDQELVDELKKRKSERIVFAVLMGVLVGCAVWSATNKGGLWTFAVLALVLFMGKKNSGRVEEVVKELNNRKQ